MNLNFNMLFQFEDVVVTCISTFQHTFMSHKMKLFSPLLNNMLLLCSQNPRKAKSLYKLVIFLIEFKSTSFFTYKLTNSHTQSNTMTKDFLAARDASINIEDRELLFGN